MKVSNSYYVLDYTNIGCIFSLVQGKKKNRAATQ
jgi:hypothetical protein